MPKFMATHLAAAGGVKKTIQKNREQTEKKQVAGARFKGPLLICLLNLNLTKNLHHIHCNSCRSTMSF